MAKWVVREGLDEVGDVVVPDAGHRRAAATTTRHHYTAAGAEAASKSAASGTEEGRLVCAVQVVVHTKAKAVCACIRNKKVIRCTGEESRIMTIIIL